MQLDLNDRITAVLFAHPESLAFLSEETEADSIWALERLRSFYELCQAGLPQVILTDRCLACMNAVSQCFPESNALLCIWHANKAVLQRCLPSFVKPPQGFASAERSMAEWETFYGHWHSIVRSKDELAFEKTVQELENRYLSEHLNEVGYIRTTWLDLYKEKLVRAWVDNFLHFENVATSRVEGIHSLLKSYLEKSTFDLFEAWRAIKEAILNQLNELRHNQAKQQSRSPIELSSP
jgi:hypothetical protein